ncbi:MAG: hypothetical protein ACRDQ7_20835 [Haloechinothrix sp.]
MADASNVYPYFVCGGRYAKRTACTRGAILIEDVETLIEDYYTRIQITPAMQQSLAGMLHHELDRLMTAEAAELAALTANRDRLENERRATRPEPRPMIRRAKV